MEDYNRNIKSIPIIQDKRKFNSKDKAQESKSIEYQHFNVQQKYFKQHRNVRDNIQNKEKANLYEEI